MANVVRFELPETVTYRHRSCQWISGVTSGDGLLMITLTHRRGAKPSQSDLYGVEEVPSAMINCRQFQLVNLSDSEQEQPYLATIGETNSCQCSAGRMCPDGVSCKHVDALHWLVESKAYGKRKS